MLQMQRSPGFSLESGIWNLELFLDPNRETSAAIGAL